MNASLAALLDRPFATLRLEWHEALGMLRVRTRVKPVQCYSLSALGDLQRVLHGVEGASGLVRHFVLSSDVPGVFNFGGDLSLFVLLIRARDVDSLRLYGKRCVDLVWWMENASRFGVHTTVLVQGDTLGGGLESVLPFHRIIFERGAQAGFPEVLFNLFPGMGAWNFTVRRAGAAVANEMILTGQLYTAEQLFERRLIDLVVETGEGEAAILSEVQAVDPRLRGTLAALEGRRRATPIDYGNLIEIVDAWADAALGLTDRDLRLMERLARAQARKVGGAPEGAVEELKQHELDRARDEEKLARSRSGPGPGGSP